MSDSTFFEQRLLAEAVRHFEVLSEQPLNDRDANRQARAASGEFEQRLLHRAALLAPAEQLRAALRQLQSLTIWCLLAGIFVAGLAGAATARLALQPASTEPLNFFWSLGGLLALPLLTLLVWLGLILARPKTLGSGSLGGLLHGLGRRLLQRWHPDATHIAAARANSVLLSPVTGGQWALSALSHLIWLAYLSACLIMCVFLLSVRQYDFGWQTTILSAEAYIQLTTALAALPSWLGFSTPDAAQIAASQWPHAQPANSTADSAWSGLLLGSIVAYGLLPRALLLLFCLWRRRRCLQRFQLDVEQPEYARLRAILMPQMEKIGIVDPDRSDLSSEPPSLASTAVPEHGPIALIGLEIDPPACGWPPLEHDDWLDLGLVEDRLSRQRALQQLREAERPPRQLLVVSSLALTPDRGLQRFLSQLRQTTAAPILLILSQGQRLRLRAQAEDLPQRLADWQNLAAAAGIAEEQVLALDLDHLTAASRAQLCEQLDIPAQRERPSAEALPAAFELIIDHSKTWREYPDEADQAALHKAIAELFDSRRTAGLLRLPSIEELQHKPKQALRQSAEHFSQLLPARLRAQPRWLAAGALAGALGCTAIAALTSPAAIAALPLWAVLGGALAGLRSAPPAAPSTETRPDLFEPVSAAALFALVLSLQGRPEAAISRILEQTLEQDPPSLPDSRAARTWLNEVQSRLNVALAREAA